jgi:hypothetical protein
VFHCRGDGVLPVVGPQIAAGEGRVESDEIDVEVEACCYSFRFCGLCLARSHRETEVESFLLSYLEALWVLRSSQRRRSSPSCCHTLKYCGLCLYMNGGQVLPVVVPST